MYLMNLSDNFTLGEMLRSDTALANDIREQFDPPVEIGVNLTKLAIMVLQPLREIFNGPLTVTSGYRCERLNKAVRGSENSDHMRGLAADITCSDVALLYELAAELPFRQLIYYRERNFVHISFDPDDARKQKWVQE